MPGSGSESSRSMGGRILSALILYFVVRVIIVVLVVGIIRPPRTFLLLVPPDLQQHTQRQHRLLSLDLASDPVPFRLELRDRELLIQVGEHGERSALDGVG